MKYCVKCGKPNVDEAVFCVACGNPFPKEEQPGAEKPASVSESTPTPVEPPKTPPSSEMPSTLPATKKKKWVIVALVAGISVFCLIGCLIGGIILIPKAVEYFSSQNEESGSSYSGSGDSYGEGIKPPPPEPVTVELVDDIWTVSPGGFLYQGWELPANATITGDIYVQTGADISFWIVGEKNLRKLLNREGEVKGYKGIRIKSQHINYTTPKAATYYLVLYNEGLLDSKNVRVHLSVTYIP